MSLLYPAVASGSKSAMRKAQVFSSFSLLALFPQPGNRPRDWSGGWRKDKEKKGLTYHEPDAEFMVLAGYPLSLVVGFSGLLSAQCQAPSSCCPLDPEVCFLRRSLTPPSSDTPPGSFCRGLLPTPVGLLDRCRTHIGLLPCSPNLVHLKYWCILHPENISEAG